VSSREEEKNQTAPVCRLGLAQLGLFLEHCCRRGRNRRDPIGQQRKQLAVHPRRFGTARWPPTPALPFVCRFLQLLLEGRRRARVGARARQQFPCIGHRFRWRGQREETQHNETGTKWRPYLPVCATRRRPNAAESRALLCLCLCVRVCARVLCVLLRSRLSLSLPACGPSKRLGETACLFFMCSGGCSPFHSALLRGRGGEGGAAVASLCCGCGGAPPTFSFVVVPAVFLFI